MLYTGNTLNDKISRCVQCDRGKPLEGKRDVSGDRESVERGEKRLEGGEEGPVREKTNTLVHMERRLNGREAIE